MDPGRGVSTTTTVWVWTPPTGTCCCCPAGCCPAGCCPPSCWDCCCAAGVTIAPSGTPAKQSRPMRQHLGVCQLLADAAGAHQLLPRQVPCVSHQQDTQATQQQLACFAAVPGCSSPGGGGLRLRSKAMRASPVSPFWAALVFTSCSRNHIRKGNTVRRSTSLLTCMHAPTS